MRYNKTLLVLFMIAALLASCVKNSYDVTQVNSVDVDGELLLPIASKSFTMMDMMARFHLDSLVNSSETGELFYNYSFEDNGAVMGHRLLRFKDLSYTEHYAFDNPFFSLQPQITDTMISFQKTIVFDSDHISALEAVMKSGHLGFQMVSNMGNLSRVVLRSEDIKDSAGNDFVFDELVQANAFGFDLENLHYLTDTANTLTFRYYLYYNYVPSTDPELFVDINIQGENISMHSMRGFVETYGNRNQIDTTFSLFPDNITGTLDVQGVSMKIYERNTFPLAARLVVDTALVMGDGLMSYSIFEPMPLVVEMPSQDAFSEVFSQSLHGKINASGGKTYASTDFIVNPAGVNEMVTVDDTCSIDVRVDVSIPFAFKADHVQYVDTVNMKLSQLNIPDVIESITLELTFISTIPLNLYGQFYMYNSESQTIMDVLVSDAQLIQASFDNQPTMTTAVIDITEERVENVLCSDRIIMVYAVDTDAHEVQLNANQELNLSVKAKIKYNGIVEP